MKVGNFIKIDDSFFSLEIADTSEERQKGLMFREYLPEKNGMLFVFDEIDIHSFWMKNTLIPLKMIWISEDFQVVDIQAAVPCKKNPCKVYEPKGDAKFVLEVNAKELKNLEIGDVVEFFNK